MNYTVLVADPPWSYGSDTGRTRTAEHHYDTLGNAGKEINRMWGEIEAIDTYSEEAFGNSCRDIASSMGPRHPLRDYFNDPWDLKREKPDCQATGFWRDIWPHFIAELKKETASGVDLPDGAQRDA